MCYGRVLTGIRDQFNNKLLSGKIFDGMGIKTSIPLRQIFYRNRINHHQYYGGSSDGINHHHIWQIFDLEMGINHHQHARQIFDEMGNQSSSILSGRSRRNRSIIINIDLHGICDQSSSILWRTSTEYGTKSSIHMADLRRNQVSNSLAPLVSTIPDHQATVRLF
ncbi:hypothetical protein AVEN_198278-1 [Araneus ventricosus]|uniref:Uncharacterized protein n=1 Tax=Araneus ventricosus TaxID=182803 RepID=A0A4Y2WQW4_ARAVE|nr:hypothetical protein AVEN_198278-1 [Araneus ventricosus]